MAAFRPAGARSDQWLGTRLVSQSAHTGKTCLVLWETKAELQSRDKSQVSWKRKQEESGPETQVSPPGWP
jgi:hypothetical protein